MTQEAQQQAGSAAPPQAIRLGTPAPVQVWKLKEPVFFVGFMGAGKTSVSRKMARQLGLAAVDMDTYIERQQDCKVSDIFARGGEELFRQIEAETLLELSQPGRDPLLISCGGGVVVTERNRAILKEAGTVVFLKVSADEAKGRISDLSTRPLFNSVQDARDRNAQRLPL